MEFEKIEELIRLVDSSDLAFFELQSSNDYIKMDKSLVRGVEGRNNISASNTEIINKVIDTEISTANATKEKAETYLVKNEETKTQEVKNNVDDKNLNVITSPMVGTFYSSASPESASFVQIGDKIANGKVICIIEAMKLMNEIESDYSGVVVECLAKDGDMVEYGQPLFKVKGE